MPPSFPRDEIIMSDSHASQEDGAQRERIAEARETPHFATPLPDSTLACVV